MPNDIFLSMPKTNLQRLVVVLCGRGLRQHQQAGGVSGTSRTGVGSRQHRLFEGSLNLAVQHQLHLAFDLDHGVGHRFLKCSLCQPRRLLEYGHQPRANLRAQRASAVIS